jgi:hypothetical protein
LVAKLFLRLSLLWMGPQENLMVPGFRENQTSRSLPAFAEAATRRQACISLRPLRETFEFSGQTP